MLALYRAGRQADALDSYRRAHDVLVETLGISPGVVLRELQRAILVQDRALDDPQQVLGSTLERAAAILPGDPRQRAQSLFEYGSALIRVGELRHAASTLQAARRLAEAARERGLEECVRMQLSYLAVFADGASIGEHLAEAERAVRVLEGLADDGALAFALSYHAHLLRETGRAEAGLTLALRGADLAAGQHPDSEAKCLRMAGSCAALGPTPVDRALALCEAIAARVDPHPVARWATVAWLLAQAGRVEEARVLYERELDTLREQGVVLSLTVGMVLAALAERAAGDLGRAADLLRTVHALDRAGDVRGDVSGAAGELATVLALQGAHAEASDLADQARSSAAPDDVLSGVLWRRASALVAARERRPDDAARLAEEARARAARTDWLTFGGETLEEVAYVYRLVDECERELEALQEALALYERKGNVAGAERVRATLAGSNPWG